MDEHEASQYQGSPELYMFLASTAHDMKNSISVLSGTLENLLAGAMASGAGTAGEESHPDYTQLGQMLYQTRRLNDNLMQLLALYKDVGKPGYPFEPVANSMEELVQQVASQARILLQSRGITLELDYPENALWTLDEDLIIGVLVHAINNAIRYTRDRLRLAICIDGDYLEIRVEDNGTGFPAVMLEAGTSAMKNHHGAVNFLNNSSGLGLYFSSEVAKMHVHRQRHGSIALENGGTLGGGCFVLRLP
ncbi:sensor histidine kinase [Duganella qianjiadongensis]|uniref:histidine kinase n=1 Tax=Duganella qianjiadongensis TaxID=2692176 RepID=A0ABW9VQI7_9BURK|nr:HAMP domain-containing sensor histidine kinase [Duganella qianjiadongensis]MYM40972.1 sensor histidine kinase [Duganella qianjiadongensis]